MNADPCCAICRHATGVCLTRYACNHHVEEEARDEVRHQAGRTHSDPTGDQAVNNIMRKTQPRRG